MEYYDVVIHLLSPGTRPGIRARLTLRHFRRGKLISSHTVRDLWDESVAIAALAQELLEEGERVRQSRLRRRRVGPGVNVDSSLP